MALTSIFQPLKPYSAAPTRQLYQSLAEAPQSSVQNGVDFNTFGQAPGEAGTRGPFTPPGASNPGDPFGPLPQTDIKLQNPQAPAGGGGGSGGGGGAGGYGYYSLDSDPILAQIKAMNERQIAAAQAAAMAGRKQAQIAYGYDPNVTYEDAATQEAAKQNAFSTLAQLLFNHGERAHGLDESLNKANLFYSGERARQVGLEGRQYTLEQSQANQGYQKQIEAIAQMVLQAQQQAQEREIQGANEAMNRQLQFALANGTGIAGLLGGGGGGGPGINWTSGAKEALSRAGYSDEQILGLINQMASDRGWGPYRENGIGTNYGVQQNGQIFTDQNGRRYIEVKFGTPQGNSTERVYLP